MAALNWPKVEAHARPDGSGEVVINGVNYPVETSTLDEARQAIIAKVTETATDLGRPVRVTTHDEDGIWPLIVGPDGTVSEDPDAPLKQPKKTEPAAVPVEAPPKPTAHPASAHEAPTATVEVAQPAPTPGEPWVPFIETGADSETNTVPAAEQQPPAPAFHWHDDPVWIARSKEPASSGWRALLRLGPDEKELAQRREEFSAKKDEEAEEQRRLEEGRRQEAARRRAEEQRQEEERTRKQARDERRAAHKAKLTRTIQTNFQGTRTILVANPKGGARKTTTTYILGAMIGSTRGGSTIAWDANETMGTLGERAKSDLHHRTVVDLLEDGAQHFLDIDSARVGVLDAYVRNQGDCHFDVLASDENPNRQDQIDAEGFRKVHDILSHFYRMILVDTGNNIRTAHFTEAQKHADQLVIPVAASHDSKNRALNLMAAFTASGYDHLVASAVVLVHELEPIERDEEGNTLSNPQHELTAAEIAEAFDGRVRTVLPVPYDPALKDGGVIDYFTLAPETISAYREAAAAVSDALLDRTFNTDRSVSAE